MLFAEAELLVATVASPNGAELSAQDLGNVARFKNVDVPTGSTRVLEYYDGAVSEALDIASLVGRTGTRSVMEQIDRGSDWFLYRTGRAYRSERRADRAAGVHRDPNA